MRAPELPILTSLSHLEPSVDERFTSNAVREHVLPGDRHAGVDLTVAASTWGGLGDIAFLRVRRVSDATVLVGLLTFDELGFGTLRSAVLGQTDAQDALAAALTGAEHVVATLDADCAELLPVTGVREHRTPRRLRYFEEQVLGVRREDADLDPSVWRAAADGDRAASYRVAGAARADLYALVAMAGRDITLH